MVASEVDPFARTGGLGDVVGGLSSELADLDVEVLVVTPRYGVTRVPEGSEWWERTVSVRVGPGSAVTLGVLEAASPARTIGSLRVCLLDHPNLFARDGIYGDAHGTFGDNDVRFVTMSRGALAVAERAWPADVTTGGPGPQPPGLDVIHAHDWHAAPAILSARLTMGAAWARVRTVFTIHNLSFQGVLGADALDRLGLPRAAFDDGTLEHDGQVNLMHGAIALADRVTTVSPTYAREILTPREGCGLEDFLRLHRGKLSGILNGIDEVRFDPRTDTALAQTFDRADPFEGKGRCKRALAEELGLSDDGGPLFGSVSRLTSQKGIDLLLAILPALVERGARFVLVGTGDASLEQALRSAAERYPGRVASRITFDGLLARRVYAGSDFFVVPSRFEPCGLTQLYAMRYGAIPVVTAVGGLRDTVEPIHALFGTGTGWTAARPDPNALLVACADALDLYQDGASHRAAVVRAMARDSSWAQPARSYLDLYRGRPG